MAFLREICRRCQACGARASVELVNRHNGIVGSYCKRDGTSALKRLQRDEAPPENVFIGQRP